jgi:hypothetical protein
LPYWDEGLIVSMLINPYLFAAAGGSVVEPSLAGYNLWFNSQEGLYQDTAGTSPVTADGQTVKRWDDQVGSLGVSLQEATNGPTYKTNIVGTFPSVRGDGVNDFLSATFTYNAPFTVYFLLKKLSAGTDRLFEMGTTTLRCSIEDFPDIDRINVIFSAGTSSVDTGTTGDPEELYGVICVVFGTSGDKYIRWESATNSTTSGAISGTSNNGSKLEIFSINGGGAFGNFDILEIIGYSAAHGVANQDTVINGLGAKYGLF